MGTTYYFLPTRNLFGEDSVKETGSLMQKPGRKENSHCNRTHFWQNREWPGWFRIS